MRLSSAGNLSIGTISEFGRLTVGFGNSTGGGISAVNTSNANNTTKYASLDYSGTDTVGSVKNTGYVRMLPSDPNYVKSALSFGAREFDAVAEVLRIDGSGTIFQSKGFGITYTGISGVNVIGFKWNGPNVVARIDNVLDVTLANVSDYRIKRNIETMTSPALERVMALRPVTYKMADYGVLFKSAEDIKEGFIAHEVQEVIPSGTEGVKDDPNQIQSLRVDAILAVAVKAIQEQQAIITDLKSRIETLEAK
jgi:hypothetical protein